MNMHSQRTHSLVVLITLAAVSLPGCTAEQQAAPVQKPAMQTRKTIGKTTQKVLELKQALADGGVLAGSDIGGGGLDTAADAYRVNMGKASGFRSTRASGSRSSTATCRAIFSRSSISCGIAPGRPSHSNGSP